MSVLSCYSKKIVLVALLSVALLFGVAAKSRAQLFTHMTFATPINASGTTPGIVQIVVGGAGSWRLDITGPGVSYTTTFTGSLTLRDFVLPVADAAYTEKYTSLSTGQVYIDTIWSASNNNGVNGHNFMQEQLKNSVTLAFSTGWPGTNFPYTVGIRIPGQTAMLATHTFSGANGDGTYNWNFGGLPSNTKYEWVIVQGSSINTSDVNVIDFLTHHHVATASF